MALQVRSGRVKKSGNYVTEILKGGQSYAGEGLESLAYNSDAMGYQSTGNGANLGTVRGAFALGFRLSLPLDIVQKSVY